MNPRGNSFKFHATYCTLCYLPDTLATGDEGEEGDSIPLLWTLLALGRERSAPGPLQLLLLQLLPPAVGCTRKRESSDGCSFQSSSAKR